MYRASVTITLLHSNSPFNTKHSTFSSALTRSAGCSKRPSRKAAASEDPEAYPLGYVEDLSDARTPLAGFFSFLLNQRATLPSYSQAPAPQHDTRDDAPSA